jgi:cell division protein FtsQ
MKRFKAQHEPRKNRKSKKEKFWAGSGKFLLVLMILYALILGINEIVGLGKKQEQNFKAENIEVTGNEILSSEKIKDLCDYDFTNSKTNDTNIEEIAESLMKSDFIKGVSVTKRLPRTLNITIEEREPIAFIYGRGLNLIDGEGFLMPVPKIKKSWDLPFISGITESLGKLGEKTNSEQALNAVSLVSHLELNNSLMLALISEINMDNSRLFELTMINGGAKIRINRTEYDKELYVLQNYVKSYLDWSEMAQIDYIDLRFKDQLVVKKKS